MKPYHYLLLLPLATYIAPTLACDILEQKATGGKRKRDDEVIDQGAAKKARTDDGMEQSPVDQARQLIEKYPPAEVNNLLEAVKVPLASAVPNTVENKIYHDYVLAETLLRTAASQGNQDAVALLKTIANSYCEHVSALEPNSSHGAIKAFVIYAFLNELGDETILHRLGKFYLGGIGTARNLDAAKDCLIKAYMQNKDLKILITIGQVADKYYAKYVQSKLEADINKAFTIWSLMADSGDDVMVALANWGLATCHRDGLGTPSNIGAAKDCYLKAYKKIKTPNLLSNIIATFNRFNDPTHHQYNSYEAIKLSQVLISYPELDFESMEHMVKEFRNRPHLPEATMAVTSLLLGFMASHKPHDYSLEGVQMWLNNLQIKTISSTPLGKNSQDLVAAHDEDLSRLNGELINGLAKTAQFMGVLANAFNPESRFSSMIVNRCALKARDLESLGADISVKLIGAVEETLKNDYAFIPTMSDWKRRYFDPDADALMLDIFDSKNINADFYVSSAIRFYNIGDQHYVSIGAQAVQQSDCIYRRFYTAGRHDLTHRVLSLLPTDYNSRPIGQVFEPAAEDHQSLVSIPLEDQMPINDCLARTPKLFAEVLENRSFQVRHNLLSNPETAVYIKSFVRPHLELDDEF